MISKPKVIIERNMALFFRTDDEGIQYRLLANAWTLNQVEPYALALDYPMRNRDGFRQYYLLPHTAQSIRKQMRRIYRDAGVECPV